MKELSIDNIFNDDFNMDTIIENNGENISGGQKQIISLLRGLVSKSNIVLLDEPFNHLDEDIRKKLVMYLDKYRINDMILIVSYQDIDLGYERIVL